MQIPRDIGQGLANRLPARGTLDDGVIGRLGAEHPASIRRGVSPAVTLIDAVQISPEAKAASQFAARPSAVPTPAELQSGLQAVMSLTATRPEDAVRQLANVVRRLATQVPTIPATGAEGDPAAALVRTLLSQAGANPVSNVPGIVRLVRNLLMVSGEPAATLATSTAVFERAAALILLSIVRWRADGGTLFPDAVLANAPGELPPALYSLIGGAPERRQRNRPKQAPPRTKLPSQEEDPAPEQPNYRSSPRRT